MANYFAWSYSALTAFETCPKQYYHLKVAKDVSEKPSQAMLEGSRLHKALEDRVKTGRPLPGKYSQHEKLANKFIIARERDGAEVFTEEQVALDSNLEPTTYFKTKGKPDPWVRCVLDVAVLGGKTLRIFDYKTGKRKPDSQQLELSAGVGFARWPQVKKIKTAFLWLQSGEVDSEEFTREDIPYIWGGFEPRVRAMQEAVEAGYFPERPSGLCKGWCPVKTCPNWEPKHG